MYNIYFTTHTLQRAKPPIQLVYLYFGFFGTIKAFIAKSTFSVFLPYKLDFPFHQKTFFRCISTSILVNKMRGHCGFFFSNF